MKKVIFKYYHSLFDREQMIRDLMDPRVTKVTLYISTNLFAMAGKETYRQVNYVITNYTDLVQADYATIEYDLPEGMTEKSGTSSKIL